VRSFTDRCIHADGHEQHRTATGWTWFANRPAEANEEINRLRASLAQALKERDVLKAECASISAEFGLPPTIRPAEGEIARMLKRAKEAESRAQSARVDALSEAAGIAHRVVMGGNVLSVRDTARAIEDAIRALMSKPIEARTEPYATGFGLPSLADSPALKASDLAQPIEAKGEATAEEFYAHSPEFKRLTAPSGSVEAKEFDCKTDGHCFNPFSGLCLTCGTHHARADAMKEKP
jgi:hypothetical protein